MESIQCGFWVYFTKIDPIRIKEVGDEEGFSPVVVWVGVHLGSKLPLRPPTTRLWSFSPFSRTLGSRMSTSTSASPATSATRIGISIAAPPNSLGIAALYITVGGDSRPLLGLSCPHLFIGSPEPNFDYPYLPNAPGIETHSNVVDSVKLTIARHEIAAKRCRKLITGFEEREKGTDAADVETARAKRVEAEELVAEAYKVMLELLGCSLASRRTRKIRANASLAAFSAPHGVFKIDKSELPNGLKGNAELRRHRKIPPSSAPPRRGWQGIRVSRGPSPSTTGTASDELIRNPDMFDGDGEPYMMAVFHDMYKHQTSTEWGIINYDGKSEVFSAPGDAGSIVADIHGRISDMLTGGAAGKTKMLDMTYATLWWRLLERIRANGSRNAHLNVLQVPRHLPAQ
ncbi:hypothetical protein FRB98_007320 [Tulasnella sp. 332]|nr:hypothetical protein FRB98_007320 [Tulasnella sp. 332]